MGQGSILQTEPGRWPETLSGQPFIRAHGGETKDWGIESLANGDTARLLAVCPQLSGLGRECVRISSFCHRYRILLRLPKKEKKTLYPLMSLLQLCKQHIYPPTRFLGLNLATILDPLILFLNTVHQHSMLPLSGASTAPDKFIALAETPELLPRAHTSRLTPFSN